MRNLRSASVVSGSRLMGLVALLCSACGGLPEDMDSGSTLDVQAQQSALAPDQCAPTPADQTHLGSVVYFRYSSGKTWSNAQADCTAMGGHLAVPTSSASNAAIFSIIGTDLTYIGLHQASGQSSTSAGWQTPAGGAATYFNWSSGEPNDMDGYEDDFQDCARMYTTGYWDDVACSQVSPYVCEFPVAPLQCGGGSSCALGTDSNYHCFCPAGQHFDPQHNACANGP
jgi:Lectin C-type domain